MTCNLVDNYWQAREDGVWGVGYSFDVAAANINIFC